MTIQWVTLRHPPSILISFFRKDDKEMFAKSKLKKEIKSCKEKIELLEHKRNRSQAALLDAILNHKDPDDEDVDYFNQFTVQIDTERARLHVLMDQFNAASR